MPQPTVQQRPRLNEVIGVQELWIVLLESLDDHQIVKSHPLREASEVIPCAARPAQVEGKVDGALAGAVQVGQ